MFSKKILTTCARNDDKLTKWREMKKEKLSLLNFSFFYREDSFVPALSVVKMMLFIRRFFAEQFFQ